MKALVTTNLLHFKTDYQPGYCVLIPKDLTICKSLAENGYLNHMLLISQFASC